MNSDNDPSGKKLPDRPFDRTPGGDSGFSPMSVEITTDGDFKKEQKEILQKAINGEIESSKSLRYAGLFVIVAGVALIFLGYTGSIDFSFVYKGFSSDLENASPGAFCVLVGIALLIFSRPKIKIKFSKPKNK